MGTNHVVTCVSSDAADQGIGVSQVDLVHAPGEPPAFRVYPDGFSGPVFDIDAVPLVAWIRGPGRQVLIDHGVVASHPELPAARALLAEEARRLASGAGGHGGRSAQAMRLAAAIETVLRYGDE